MFTSLNDAKEAERAMLFLPVFQHLDIRNPEEKIHPSVHSKAFNSKRHASVIELCSCLVAGGKKCCIETGPRLGPGYVTQKLKRNFQLRTPIVQWLRNQVRNVVNDKLKTTTQQSCSWTKKQASDYRTCKFCIPSWKRKAAWNIIIRIPTNLQNQVISESNHFFNVLIAARRSWVQG